MSRPRPKLCKKHPYYQAIRKPRVDCSVCWMAYYEKNIDPEKAAKVVRHVAEIKYGKDKVRDMEKVINENG